MDAPDEFAARDDFDRLSWHDNLIYGFRFVIGDHEKGEWNADLVFDIDHIAEWVCPIPGGRVQFRVAPATLTFHDVTDFKISADFGDSGGQTNLNEMSIDRIGRERLVRQNVRLDRPYYRWTIALNDPRGGVVSFGASGFTQILRAAPQLLDEQRLPRGAR
ncbi:MAG: hypothetical protein U1F33_13220 [Alphaproteobacteria bacterium]